MCLFDIGSYLSNISPAVFVAIHLAGNTPAATDTFKGPRRRSTARVYIFVRDDETEDVVVHENGGHMCARIQWKYFVSVSFRIVSYHSVPYTISYSGARRAHKRAPVGTMVPAGRKRATCLPRVMQLPGARESARPDSRKSIRSRMRTYATLAHFQYPGKESRYAALIFNIQSRSYNPDSYRKNNTSTLCIVC